MSQIKRFALWLSKCVYDFKMSDAAMLEATQVAHAEEDRQVDPTWLKTQLEAVQKNPEIYQEMKE